jgi:Mg-chelatase subunit ChlD
VLAALISLGVVLLLGVTGLIVALMPLRRQEPQLPPPQSSIASTPPVMENKNEEAQNNTASPPVEQRPPDLDIRPREVEKPTGPRILALPEIRMSQVEVVFCLDTTDSMGGLLQGAKQKIWAMCNQIAGGKPTPDLQVGLVAYRDRGDAYITNISPLTRDLDHIQTEINALEAKGGGDTPESVNQALDDAINKMAWSKDKHTMRLVFLVGDAPPHMDYRDDVKYPETCKKATELGILINTIQCGEDRECRRAWVDIAEHAKGEFVAIPQRGGVVSLASPYDRAIAELGRKLIDSALLYGDKKQKERGEKMLDVARKLAGPAAADRTAFMAKSKRISPYDLVEAVQAKRVKLDKLPVDELPAAMEDLETLGEREVYLSKAAREREPTYAKILDLEKQRAAFLRKKTTNKDSFDGKVLDVLRKQAKNFAIDY